MKDVELSVWTVLHTTPFIGKGVTHVIAYSYWDAYRKFRQSSRAAAVHGIFSGELTEELAEILLERDSRS